MRRVVAFVIIDIFGAVVKTRRNKKLDQMKKTRFTNISRYLTFDKEHFVFACDVDERVAKV